MVMEFVVVVVMTTLRVAVVVAVVVVMTVVAVAVVILEVVVVVVMTVVNPGSCVYIYVDTHTTICVYMWGGGGGEPGSVGKDEDPYKCFLFPRSPFPFFFPFLPSCFLYLHSHVFLLPSSFPVVIYSRLPSPSVY
jgi:hypothetical protein